MAKVGRPTKYDPKFIESVMEYIMLHQDVEKENEGKYGGINYSIRAKLPTIEGFASFIKVTKSSLYEWEAKYPEFSYALEELRREQKERLINEGLSGNYNSTIAKLILSSNHGMSDKVSNDLTTGGLAINFSDAFKKE